MVMILKGNSRCAGLTTWWAVTLVFAALPDSAAVIWRMEIGQASLITAADLAQDFQPLTGFYTVSCLHIQRLLRVDHLKHLTHEKQQFKSQTTTGLKFPGHCRPQVLCVSKLSMTACLCMQGQFCFTWRLFDSIDAQMAFIMNLKLQIKYSRFSRYRGATNVK